MVMFTEGYDTPVLVTRNERNEFTESVATVADDHLKCEQTRMGPRIVGEDNFKIRGIEARQRSTPPFIEDVQRDCLDRLDATRSPDAVLGRLERAVNELQAGNVAVSGSSNGIVSPSR
ncbi:Vng6163h (plasmid) [Halobacterium salinarum NRC-1]|uniref:DNA-directed DNA polymerase n=4 Tax=Halobacterium salinarum TaxID=2242 RepID=Q9HHY9_HALSA|nr:Vng6163h [Halobacterium salinarum NRC-1]MBB6090656.1 hypothetical protein [Halobacterium salinarum]